MRIVRPVGRLWCDRSSPKAFRFGFATFLVESVISQSSISFVFLTIGFKLFGDGT